MIRGRPRASATDAAVGERVRQYRLRAGITQEKLGAALGVSFQQVQKYEKGANRIAAARLGTIAAALGTTSAALLGAEVEAPAADLSADAFEVARAINAMPAGAQRAALVEAALALAAAGQGAR